jgi:rhodanese-related sulfurtransferase
MIQRLKKFLGAAPVADLSELVKKGAQIIDVRTPGEYQSGHIQGSVNIPLQQLSENILMIEKNKPVITCCASGIRSASAKSFLRSKGFTDVYNGGSWQSLQKKIF